MEDKFRNFLMSEYAGRIARSESMDFTKGYYKNKIKDLSWYNNDKELMKKHQRFLNYIYSTFEKYIIHRNIIIYYYEKITCSISVLSNTVDISRTGLTRIINDSIAEGWLYSKVNPRNKRQILIYPTVLRVDFWLLYCKSKYEKGKSAGLADAHKALYHYDKNLEKYSANKKLK
tara:strand:+ start:81 stop:602 length:522 start_codon:yes stop_codon:yes gene_type:complete